MNKASFHTVYLAADVFTEKSETHSINPNELILFSYSVEKIQLSAARSPTQFPSPDDANLMEASRSD